MPKFHVYEDQTLSVVHVVEADTIEAAIQQVQERLPEHHDGIVGTVEATITSVYDGENKKLLKLMTEEDEL
jgi:hypothetical protein